jgi:hypothetical protein
MAYKKFLGGKINPKWKQERKRFLNAPTCIFFSGKWHVKEIA